MDVCMMAESKIPNDFFWRRFHSLMGLWLVLFLIEHLLTNSQASLWMGEDGSGFVNAVNGIQNLPYLYLIEFFLLGVPFAIHMVWGIKRLLTAKFNSFKSDGATPSLPEYLRNHAFTWQRITSWILVFAIIGHVTQMRFYNYPTFTKLGHEEFYMIRLNKDTGLDTLASRLNVTLYDTDQIKLHHFELQKKDNDQESQLQHLQDTKQQEAFTQAIQSRPLEPGEVIAVAHDFGTAELLVVRETFKTPMMLILYTLFVLAAVFHAFNGLWTFLITWGISLTVRSQHLMRSASLFMMALLASMGLAAIWGTYFITLNS